MNKSDISVRLLDVDQIDGLAIQLNSAGLPTQDLLQSNRMFYSFHHGDTTLGYGGIEGNGPDRLLRSLVIVPAQRQVGAGTLLLQVLERIAAADGALHLHLLTNSAEDFFQTRGYERRKRSQAPEAISSSAEFTALCPASAVYMVKKLDSAGAAASVSPDVTCLNER